MFIVRMAWREMRWSWRRLLFFFLSTMFTYALMLFAPATLVGLGALTSAFPSGMDRPA